jgi:hypothetical protein
MITGERYTVTKGTHHATDILSHGNTFIDLEIGQMLEVESVEDGTAVLRVMGGSSAYPNDQRFTARVTAGHSARPWLSQTTDQPRTRRTVQVRRT